MVGIDDFTKNDFKKILEKFMNIKKVYLHIIW